MQKFVENLATLGLRKREIKVLTTLHVFGRLNVTKLAERSKLPRTTVDAILRRLQEKGYVRRVAIGGHAEWKGNDILKTQSRANVAFDAIQKEINPSFFGPILESIDAKDVGIQVFRGKKQVQGAYTLLGDLSGGKPVKVIQGGQFGTHYLKTVFERKVEMDFSSRLRDMGIVIEGVTSESTVRELSSFLDTDYLKHVFDRPMILYDVPPEMINFPGEVVIFEKEVMLSLPKDVVVVRIVNQAIASIFKAFYETLVHTGKKINTYELMQKILEERGEK